MIILIPGAVRTTSGNLYFPGHAGVYTHRLCHITQFRLCPQMAVPSRGA